jgi:hypothetical protein
MLERIIRLIRLEPSVFGEIESDPQATTQAAIIVTVSSLLSALGLAMISPTPATSFIGGFVNGLAGWIIWSAVTYALGKSLFSGGGTFEQMLRVLGYASAPSFLGVFAFVPCLGLFAGFAGWLISLIAGVMAIREALDLGWAAAIVVVVIGAVASGILYAVLGVLLTGTLSLGAGLWNAVGGA